jgi:hypothetical protein
MTEEVYSQPFRVETNVRRSIRADKAAAISLVQQQQQQQQQHSQHL